MDVYKRTEAKISELMHKLRKPEARDLLLLATFEVDNDDLPKARRLIARAKKLEVA